MSNAPQPPAHGWYAAPDNAEHERWFDGVQWTHHARQRLQQVPQAVAHPEVSANHPVPEFVAPAAGWYPAPDNAEHDRWFDGVQWTHHARQRLPQAVAQPGVSANHAVPWFMAPTQNLDTREFYEKKRYALPAVAFVAIMGLAVLGASAAEDSRQATQGSAGAPAELARTDLPATRVEDVQALPRTAATGASGCGKISNGSMHVDATCVTPWPFKVSSGKLMCEAPGAVLFATNGKVYAVNGLADTYAPQEGWLDIGPIWAADPTGSTPKVSLDGAIFRGLDICD